ncbi:MAG: hypothetical protein ACO3E1_12295 [Flavobacteriales bacterium]
MKKLIFVFLLLLNAICFAQIKLIQATKQAWVGGMQGYYGAYYNAQFKYKTKDSITIDSLYLNGMGYTVMLSNNDMGQPHWYKSKENNKKVIKFFFKESVLPCTIPDFSAESNKPKTEEKPLRTFKGEALIIYHVNGKKKKLVITKFTLLEAINYP